MKLQRLLPLFIAAGLMSAGLASCDDDTPDGGGEGGDIDGDLVEAPTEDVLKTMIDHPVAILESGYDEVSERVIARMSAQSTAVTPETKIVLMNGRDNYTITPDLWNTLKEVYDRGGIIMITNPDEGTRGWLEKSLQFNNTGPDPDSDGKPDWDGNPAGESIFDIYAFTAAGDHLEMDDIYNPQAHSHEVVLVDSLGNKTNEVIVHDGDEEPTQYQYGQFAESVARWVNIVLDTDERAEQAARAASRVSGSARDFYISGEFDSKIMPVYLSEYDITSDVDGARYKSVTLPVTVMYYVSAAYNFDDGYDYYYAELTEETSCTNLWKGIKKHHPYGAASGWAQAGYAIDQIDVGLRLTALSPTYLNPAQLLSYSPVNVVGSKTVTTTEGWNLGGGASLGLAKTDKWGMTFTGNFTFNHVKTTAVAKTVYDMAVEYKSALGAPEPKWEYTIPRFSLSGALVGSLSDVSDYHTGRKPITISQVVVWKEKPNQALEQDHILHLDYTVHHYMKRKRYGKSSKTLSQAQCSGIDLKVGQPGRHKYNYSLQPVHIHDNAEWIQIMTILNDVSGYRELKDFTKCSPIYDMSCIPNVAACEYLDEHYKELQNNCRRIINVQNTYELALFNMTTGDQISDRTILIKPGGY